MTETNTNTCPTQRSIKSIQSGFDVFFQCIGNNQKTKMVTMTKKIVSAHNVLQGFPYSYFRAEGWVGCNLKKQSYKAKNLNYFFSRNETIDNIWIKLLFVCFWFGRIGSCGGQIGGPLDLNKTTSEPLLFSPKGLIHQ